ncbi:Zn(II)2Cys6 transcription factor domain-containing protein [Aspergillus homomorphus CBS 101889]|uniref:Zn(2)-C6 fungal-type domain-containing protein n=1 Tax=Aspergillus homomorphus (strain CBS 101889) TaxID=1450537 RepID=A0A395HR16_ASPHC|nr:hypothetical protein BO97DRAFT_145681 [Aspergillus homomorphus CBS 101889]RAL10036.1 hypothetical protein BO97DRAFT_145681 [Aspergillus homomorphus CBS 101889]
MPSLSSQACLSRPLSRVTMCRRTNPRCVSAGFPCRCWPGIFLFRSFAGQRSICRLLPCFSLSPAPWRIVAAFIRFRTNPMRSRLLVPCQPSQLPLASRACAACTAKKRKCDKQLPSCSLCTRTETRCSYKRGSTEFILVPVENQQVPAAQRQLADQGSDCSIEHRIIPSPQYVMPEESASTARRGKKLAISGFPDVHGAKAWGFPAHIRDSSLLKGPLYPYLAHRHPIRC